MIVHLIERALLGAVSLKEFYALWPEELEEDSRFENIYNDLENAIEHFPGALLTGKPKMDVFQRSEEYQRLKSYLADINSQK